MRISDWSSDVCSSDLPQALVIVFRLRQRRTADEKPRPMLAPMARASLAGWPAPVAIAPPPFVTALPNCVTIAAAPPPSEAAIPGIWMKKKQARMRSEEHTYELQSLMRNTKAVCC